MDRYTALKSLHVAAPCSASWEDMEGDDKKRFCSQCALHVHNVSAMTADEAEEFLQTSGGQACVRFFRRADDTVITRNCPVGLAKLRKKLARGLLVTAGFCMSVYAAAFSSISKVEKDSLSTDWSQKAYVVPAVKSVVDKIDVERPVMGRRAGYNYDPMGIRMIGKPSLEAIPEIAKPHSKGDDRQKKHGHTRRHRK